ncbi:MAG TPA: hypothetical protein VKD22_11825 [Ramlibacter sp.]|nr:hypothetical protein [Ramlibacter sp.]
MNEPNVRKGDTFIVTRDLPTQGLVHWQAPLTTGFACVLPAGTVLVVYSTPTPGSTFLSCTPVESAEAAIESRVVPEKDRNADGYAGYSFVLPVRLIGSGLQRCP